MKLEDLAIVAGLVLVLWLAGYHSLALVTLGLFIIVAIFIKEEPKKAKSKLPEGVSVKGPAEVLEPIIIEVKRNPPFIVPEKANMVLQAKGYKKIDREKYSTQFFYPLAVLIYRLLGGKKKD